MCYWNQFHITSLQSTDKVEDEMSYLLSWPTNFSMRLSVHTFFLNWCWFASKSDLGIFLHHAGILSPDAVCTTITIQGTLFVASITIHGILFAFLPLLSIIHVLFLIIFLLGLLFPLSSPRSFTVIVRSLASFWCSCVLEEACECISFIFFSNSFVLDIGTLVDSHVSQDTQFDLYMLPMLAFRMVSLHNCWNPFIYVYYTLRWNCLIHDSESLLGTSSTCHHHVLWDVNTFAADSG